MTTLEISEMYVGTMTTKGQLGNITGQSDTIDAESIAVKSAYLDALEEVIHFQ